MCSPLHRLSQRRHIIGRVLSLEPCPTLPALGGCRKKPPHLKIADTLFEGDVGGNICDFSDFNGAAPIIHERKRISLSEAVFPVISFNTTAMMMF